MKSFFEEFNNREIAIIIWILVFIILMSFAKDIRESFRGIIKVFFAKKLMMIFLSLIAYTIFIVYFLLRLKFWDFELLKDTFFWFFGVAFLLVFNISDKTDIGFFKKTLIHSFKWTIIIEFISNLYVFGLLIELMLVFFLILFSMMKPFAERDKRYLHLKGPINNMLILLGSVIIVFAIYKTIADYRHFFTVSNAKSFLLSPILTALYIPFLYLLALTITYEQVFMHLKFRSNGNDAFLKGIKWETIKSAKLNISQLNRVWAKILKTNLYRIEDVSDYIKMIRGNKELTDR